MVYISNNCSSSAGNGSCINAFTFFFFIGVTLLILGLAMTGLIWRYKKLRALRAKPDPEHRAWSGRVDFEADELELHDLENGRRGVAKADVQTPAQAVDPLKPPSVSQVGLRVSTQNRLERSPPGYTTTTSEPSRIAMVENEAETPPPKQSKSSDATRRSRFHEHLEEEKTSTASRTPLPPSDKDEDLSDLVDSPRTSMQSVFSDGFPEGWGRVIRTGMQ